MFAKLGKFIGGYKIYIIIGLVIISLCGTIMYLNWRVNSLEGQIGECSATVDNYKEAEKEWQNTIAVQNQSIENLKDTTTDLNKKLTESRNKRQKIQDRYESRIRDLAEEKVPESCDGSVNYLLEKAIETSE